MNKCYCDICGKEFKNYSEIERYKIKKDSHFYDFCWYKLDVHEECWQGLCELVKEKNLDAK